ncbi:hypothetical protein BASA61_008597 [Batrachochytrium salamandrivorans]|nr:hypothetical protein BASA61_008597 [Batrachochytrium salamandrivorans]
MGRSHTRSQELSREFVVGLGREDLTLVLQVEVFHSTRRLNIHWDIRKVAFPFGVLVGRRVRLDHLSIKQLRHDASEDTQIGTNTPLFRICSLLSSPPPRLQQVCLLAVITTIAQVSFTAICQSCKRPCSRNVCPSNCTHPEFGISAQAVVFVDDGTAEASITLSGIESVTTLLQLSALITMIWNTTLMRMDLFNLRFLLSIGMPLTLQKTIGSLLHWHQGNSGLKTESIDQVTTDGFVSGVKVGASHGSFLDSPPPICSSAFHNMHCGSAAHAATISKRWRWTRSYMTLSYKPIRLYSLCLSEISARDLALDLLSSLCRKS